MIAAPSDSADGFLYGTAFGPAPRAVTRLAQNGWSVITGTLTVGTPARNPAGVVPAPALWTTAAIGGNSQSWGASPMTITSPAPCSAAAPRFAQPDWMTIRT